MTTITTTADLHAYREQTTALASCKGVMSPSFRCVCCGVPRSVIGRKQRVSGDRRSGWVCRECQR